MKTIEMEIALMDHLGIRQNIIVPNVSWPFLSYEADLVVLTKSNYATEIEIKVSKQDLKKDIKKKHDHDSEFFKYLYFAVPEELKDFALSNIPEKAGLYVVSYEPSTFKKYWVNQVKAPKLNKYHIKWAPSQRAYLAELGCMRILGLKKKVLKGIKECTKED